MSAPSRSVTVIICIDRTYQKLSNRKETKGITLREVSTKLGKLCLNVRFETFSSDRYGVKSVIN